MSDADILLADDDEIGRYVIAVALRRFGFGVREAADGPATLAAAAEAVPDLVVLDVQMPGMDGFEVCRRLKADPRTAGVPILLLSATFLESEFQVRGLGSGADAYLTQPVEPPVLDATVRALLRARRAEQEVRLVAEQWRTTFDAMNDAVCVLRGDDRILRANRAFGGLTGRDPATLAGVAVQEVLPEARLDADAGELAHAARTLRFRLHAVLDPDADARQRVLTLTDITDERAHEARRRQAQERDRTIALLLQRSLMPERLAQAPGVRIAASHRSAGQGSLVGGDFYDALEVGPDELWLVMGDVAGHGVETAAKASELRQSLRVYAREGYEPADALARLNELVLADDLVGMATACLVRFRRGSGEAEVLLAGHPPPVLVDVGGSARLLEASRGPILGFPRARWVPARHAVPPGTRLVLYTDGLVERPGDALDDGFEGLRRAAEALPADGDAAVAALFGLLREDEELRDDVAVVVADLTAT